MSANDFRSYGRSGSASFQSIVLVLLCLGLALALAGNVYQFVKGEHLARDMELMRKHLQTEITRLSDATSGAFDVTQQRFEQMKKREESTLAALTDARSELRHGRAQAEAALDQKNQQLLRKNQELMAELAALKKETGTKLQTASAGLQTTNAKFETTRAKLDQVSAEAEKNRADIKRISNDMGSLKADVHPKPQRAPVLRETSDRNYFPFDLLKTKVPTTIGPIQIAIRSTDPKRNRYTMDLYADEKVTPERTHAVNEPVQFYTSGQRLPYEIVVTEVRKDEVIGYVMAPRATTPRAQTATATLGEARSSRAQ